MEDYDQYLDWIFNLSEGSKLPMTLHVKGLQVSGTPVTQDEYMNGLGEYLIETARQQGYIDQETVDRLAEEGYQSYIRSVFGDTGDRESQGRHIHLKDVTIMGAGPRPVEFPWWRGRLSSVDGFGFGTPALEE